MSEAKEGKLLGRKKLLDPHLGTTEGTKITSTIIFYTSHALTVYSIVHAQLHTLYELILWASQCPARVDIESSRSEK